MWTWDVAAVNRVISFFAEVLCLTGSGFEGKPFLLLPWQAFVVGSLFGWKGPDGFRRFRMAYVESGKGSGKSPLAAGIGLYMLTADNEPRAEVYAAAGTKDQAQILFRDAVAMREFSPALEARLTPSGGKGKEWNLADLSHGSFFRTLASDTPKSGLRPHCGLLDEIHEHHDDSAVSMIRAGTKGRRQALIFMITNSGSSRTSVCYSYHEYAAAICAGTKVDDAFFAYVCALDPDDDPFKDESCWAKANPSLGHTITDKYLRELVTQARGMPSQEGVVRRLNFVEWTDAATAWIDRDLWEACAEDFDPDELIGLPCYGGLDLSQKRDLTSFAACWRHPDGRLSLAVWFWTPGDTLDERSRRDNVPYRDWVRNGHLFAPPGRLIDKTHVALFVQQFHLKHAMEVLAYDQAQMEDFLSACDAIGFDAWIDDRSRGDDGAPSDPPGIGLRLQRHGQGTAGYASKTVLWMPRSIVALEDAVVKAEITIKPNPVLNYNSASAVLLSDATGNRKWDKQKSNGRIDGMISSSEAVGAATASAPAPARKSIWDREEIWSQITGPAPAAAKPKSHLTKYLAWVRNAGTGATKDAFFEDFDPIGPLAWPMLSELVAEEGGRLVLTAAGEAHMA